MKELLQIYPTASDLSRFDAWLDLKGSGWWVLELAFALYSGQKGMMGIACPGFTLMDTLVGATVGGRATVTGF